MVEKIIDPVFGEMEYKHRWVKKERIYMLGAENNISIIASAYTGDKICDKQQKAYNEFIDQVKEIDSKLSKLIFNYVLEHKDEIEEHYDRIESIDSAVSLVKPMSILFSRDGKVVIMCNVDWDEENGIGIEVIPEYRIDLQDAFI